MVETAAFQDELNQQTWSSPASRRYLEEGAAFTDPGERAAMEYVAAAARSKPILDLGVGTGRTIGLLAPLSSDYRALDYLPSMVEASRQRHPGVTVELGDARSLERYPARHFGLVNFSFNGIDAVGAADRRRVFRAVRRVLAPEGMFLFSTLNLDGPSYRERPWKLRFWPSRNPLSHGRNLVRQIAGFPSDFTNWLKIRATGEHGPGFAIAPLSAHHYGVLVHFTTLARQLEELTAEGFRGDPVVFESRKGRRISVSDDSRCVDWFHVVARLA